MVVSELKPEFVLDPVKFRVGEPRVDRTDGFEPQAPHGFLTEAAIVTTLNKP